MTHASKSLWRFTKLAFLLGAMVLLPMKLNAQGYINGQAIAPTGKPASYATVRVCPYSGGGGLPCSPLSPLYSDLALTQSVGNPYTTDSYGNFSVAVASSSYIVQVYVSGAVYSYLYTIGSGGSGSGFPIILGSTSIAAGSTTTSIAGLTIDGVTPTVMGYVDPTSSIQTQLNGKQASGTYANCVAGTSANDCLTLNGSGYVPNTNLSAIPNGALANSSITIATTGAATGGGPVALGGSLTVNVGASAIAAQIAVQTGCSSITNTWNPFTNTCIAPSSGIPYPAAGIPNSTGAAWTTSYNGSNQIPASIAPGTPLTAAAVDAVGALTNSTSGTAANLSGTPALPNGTTATTQTNGDSTTELANDAFVQAAISSIPATSISTALQCTAHSASTTAYTCTTSPTFSLVNGNLIFFQPDVNNSGVNPTLSVNGATPGYILNGTGGYVTANQVYASGAIYLLEYVSGNWQIQTVPLGYPSSSVASINTVAGPFTFNFSTGAGSCAGNTCTFTGSSSGGGSVTNFLAPSGNWPAWLVPAVATGTTTPTLSVAASTIPPAAGGTGGDGTGYAYGNGTSPFSYSTTIPVASVTGAISSVTDTAPVNCTTSGSSVNCGMAQATSSVDGYLSHIDWNAFNGKQAALGFTPYNATNPAGYITSSVTTLPSLSLPYSQVSGTPSIPTVGTWGALNYPTWASGTPFVKMTAAGTFALDTNTYGTFTLPSLTSGSVLFSNGSTIAQDNSNFFWDATNHRLGIGTTTPGSRLSVGSFTQAPTELSTVMIDENVTLPSGGTHGFSDNSYIIPGSNSASGYSSFDASPIVQTSINHVNGMQFRAHVTNNSNVQNIFSDEVGPVIDSGSSVTNNYGIYIQDPTGGGTIVNDYGIYLGSVAEGTTSNYAIYSPSGAESFFGGSVGIGTATPNYPLTVNGSMGVGNSAGTGSYFTNYVNAGADLFFGLDNSAGSGFGGGAYGAVIGNYSNTPLSFITNSAQAMRILANGNVGIGTTTPAALLSVGSSSQFQVNSTGVSSAGAGSTDLNGSGVPEAHCLADGTGGCVTLGGELSCSNLVLGSAAGTGATCNAVVGYDGSHYIDFTAGSTGREGGVVFTLTFTSARASSYCTLSPMNQATAAIMTQVFYLPGGGANYALDNASTLLLANGTEYKFTAVCP